MTAGDWLKYAAAGAALAVGIGELFYRSLTAVVFFSPLILLVPVQMRGVLAEQRKERLAGQFRDGLLAAAGALSAGYAVDNAWWEAANEMAVVYGEDGEITREFRAIHRKIRMNRTSEEAVEDLAERSGIPEIRQFADVYIAARRTSGNLGPILQETADLLGRRLAVKEEIRTLAAAKRLEQNIMSVMPAAILLYVNLGNPGFTDPLYQGLAGRGIMTCCLAVYGLAIWMGRKILSVEI